MVKSQQNKFSDNFSKTSFFRFFEKFSLQDFWVLIAIFIGFVMMFSLNLAAILAPVSSYYIICGGLVPLFLLTLPTLALYFISGFLTRMFNWKDPEFWIPLSIFCVSLIGLSLCWAELANHFEMHALANPYVPGGTTPDQGNRPIVGKDETKYVPDPGKYSPITAAAQWISVIITGLVATGIFWIWYRSYLIVKAKRTKDVVIYDEKKLQQFLIENDLESDEEKQLRLEEEQRRNEKKKRNHSKN